MTRAEADEGERLLRAYNTGALQRGTGDREWKKFRDALRNWLWEHREELVTRIIEDL